MSVRELRKGRRRSVVLLVPVSSGQRGQITGESPSPARERTRNGNAAQSVCGEADQISRNSSEREILYCIARRKEGGLEAQ